MSLWLLVGLAVWALIVLGAVRFGLSWRRWSDRVDADVRFLQSVPAGMEWEQ